MLAIIVIMITFSSYFSLIFLFSTSILSCSRLPSWTQITYFRKFFKFHHHHEIYQQATIHARSLWTRSFIIQICSIKGRKQETYWRFTTTKCGGDTTTWWTLKHVSQLDKNIIFSSIKFKFQSHHNKPKINLSRKFDSTHGFTNLMCLVI